MSSGYDSEKNGSDPEQLKQMDLIDPNSLVRKKGNLLIKLTIDKDLQETLEKLVDNRGYGKDTTIIDEVRIGSDSATVELNKTPKDSVRLIRILKDRWIFMSRSTILHPLHPGDTIIVNIRIRRLLETIPRTPFLSAQTCCSQWQYYAYSIMDSALKVACILLQNRLGSRLACLLKNRTPNGPQLQNNS